MVDKKEILNYSAILFLSCAIISPMIIIPAIINYQYEKQSNYKDAWCTKPQSYEVKEYPLTNYVKPRLFVEAYPLNNAEIITIQQNINPNNNNTLEPIICRISKYVVSGRWTNIRRNSADSWSNNLLLLDSSTGGFRCRINYEPNEESTIFSPTCLGYTNSYGPKMAGWYVLLTFGVLLVVLSVIVYVLLITDF